MSADRISARARPFPGASSPWTDEVVVVIDRISRLSDVVEALDELELPYDIISDVCYVRGVTPELRETLRAMFKHSELL